MDYLKELCTELNMELIYTDDDCTALAIKTRGKKISLNADKLFMGCPKRVAKAIIGYYTENGNEDSYLKVIKTYILENVVTVEYSIEPPDDRLKGMNIQHMGSGAFPEVNMPGDKPKKDKTSSRKAPVKKASGSKTGEGSTSKTVMPWDSTSSLVELGIVSMTRKGFYGKAEKVNPDETIRVSRDDVVELDIEIDDSGL